MSVQPVSAQASVQPVSVQPASAQPGSVQTKAPWVRAASGPATTALPVLQALPVTIAMSAVDAIGGGARRIHGGPVEQTVPLAAVARRMSGPGGSRARRSAWGRLLVLGLLSVGWMLVGPGLGGRVAPRAASVMPGGSASAAPAGSASAGRRRPQLPRVKLPAP